MVKKIGYILLILIFIQILNQFLIFSGSALEQTLQPDFQYTGIVVGVYQQLVQAVTGVVLFRWLFNKDIREMGINTRNKKRSLRLFLIFAGLWTAVIALYLSATYFFFPDGWAALTTVERPSTNTMIATLLFQSFFPGMGEEILFRGLIINVLATWVFTSFRDSQASKFGIIVLSSAYFAIAHIYFSLDPFRLTHIDSLQIVTAMGCGSFYAIFYLKTKSLLAPFLAHNFANTSTSLVGYIISGL